MNTPVARQPRRTVGRQAFLARALGLAVAIVAGTLHAAEITWSGADGSVFANAANWAGGSAPADSTGTDRAVFGASLTANLPALDANRSINGLVFQKPDGGWTLGGAGHTLTLGAGGIDDTLNTGGTTTITPDILLSANQPWSSGAGGTLTATGTTTLNGHRTLTVNSGTVTLAQVASDSATARNLTKQGAGALVLAGANTHGGQTQLAAGTLVAGDTNALGTGVFFFQAGTFQASTDLSGANALGNSWYVGTGTISGAHSIEFGGDYTGTGSNRITNNLDAGKTLTISGPFAMSTTSTNRDLRIGGTGDTVISGVVSNGGTATTGGFMKEGTGTLTLSGANTFSGATITINGGTLVAAHPDALGSSTNPGTLYFQSGTLDVRADMVLTNPWYIASTTRYIRGTHNLELSGDHIGHAAIIGVLDSSLDSGRTLLISGDIAISSNSGNRRFQISGTGNTVVTGDISNGSTATACTLEKYGTGTLTLTGANTYGGGTTLSAGILVLGNTQAHTPTGTITAAAAATVGLGVGGAGYFGSADVAALFANTLPGVAMNAASGVAIDTSAGSFTYANDQGTSRALTKLGGNSLTLTGNNTYGGGTTVAGGTLLVNNSAGSGTGSGAVTVMDGATLGGGGFIAGPITVRSGGTLAPGASLGLLTVDTLTLESGASLVFELESQTTPGTTYDQIDGTNLILPDGGAVTLVLNGVGNESITANAPFTLFTGTVTNFGTTSFSIVDNTSWSGDWVLSEGSLTLTPVPIVSAIVPEPSTLALLAVAFGALLGTRRRRAR